MDVVMKSLLSAHNLSDSLKRQLIKEKLLPQSSRPIDVETCKRLLDLSWSLALTSHKILDRETGIKVFSAWAPHNRGTLAEWTGHGHLEALLSEAHTTTHRASLFQLLKIVLDNLEGAREPGSLVLTLVCQHLGLAMGRGTLTLEETLSGALLLRGLPPQPAQQLLLGLVGALAALQIQAPVPQDVKEKIDLICLVFKEMVAKEKNLSLAVINLLHELLPSRDKPCSLLLAPVVEVLGLSEREIESHCSRAVEGNLDDRSLELVLERLLSWLSWPGSLSCQTWVLCFLMLCNRNHRRSPVEAALASNLQEVLGALIWPSTRGPASLVFKYVILMYQQCPGVMKKVLDLSPRIIGQLPTASPADLDFRISLESSFGHLKTQLASTIKCLAVERGKSVEEVIQGGRAPSVGCSWKDGSTEEVSRRLPPGLGAGLENLGNTCYINSVVQALNMTYRFRHLVLERCLEGAQGILKTLQEVLAFLLMTKRPFYCPRKFVEVARPNWFTPGEQQDSQEFLNHLFDILEEEERRAAAASASLLVREVFGGTTETCVTCSLCEKTSVTRDFFYSLLLPLSGMQVPATSKEDGATPVSLEDVLSSYLKPEVLEGRNKYRCDNCDKLEDARRRIRITAAPQHLILTLLRFEYESNRRRKISVPLCLPGTLDLPVETAEGPSVVTYTLYAAIMHSGLSAEKGHYYTYARCSASGCRSRSGEDVWCLFNDEQVSHTDFRSLCDVSRRSCRDTVYMLFYGQDSGVDSGPFNPWALVSQTLRDQILIDNIKYYKEEQQKSGSKRHPAKAKDFRPRRDSDEDRSPPGSGGCGMGGGFGGLDSPSRVVF